VPAARVLVTGAGGKTGRAVLRALVGAGVPARAFVREPGRHADLGSFGDVEVAAGDQRDPGQLTAALEGCDAVYHIAPNVSADEVAMGEAVLTACARAGVRRLGFHSVLDPDEAAMPHHADKGRVERLVMATSLDWTCVRPNAYLQNLDGYLDELRAGRYRVPYATDRGLAMVDLAEVAEVVAGAFSGRLPDAVGAIWELSGPQEVTPDDVARVASEVLSRPVVAQRQDPDDWATEHRDLLNEVRTRLHRMFRYYDRHGFPGDPATLARLLGRQPRGLASYLQAALSDG
jgi:NAD(P)H dehydrogenase (quinone)